MNEIETQIRAALNDFWDERAIPAGPSGATTVEDLVEPIESMTAVEVLVTLDEIVGLKLPNSVIKPGGYRSKEEFIDELSTRVMEQVKGHEQT